MFSDFVHLPDSNEICSASKNSISNDVICLLNFAITFFSGNGLPTSLYPEQIQIFDI